MFWMVDKELSVWFPFFDLETTHSFLLEVCVSEMSVITFLELACAVSMLVVQSHYAFPKLNRLSIFRVKPILIKAGSMHDHITKTRFWIWAEEHLVSMLVQRIKYGKSDGIFLPNILDVNELRHVSLSLSFVATWKCFQTSNSIYTILPLIKIPIRAVMSVFVLKVRIIDK